MLTKLNESYNIDEATGELYYQDDATGIVTNKRGADALELALARDAGWLDGRKYGIMQVYNFVAEQMH